MLSRESTPAAVGVEGQIAKVPQHSARREFVHEDSKVVRGTAVSITCSLPAIHLAAACPCHIAKRS